MGKRLILPAYQSDWESDGAAFGEIVAVLVYPIMEETPKVSALSEGVPICRHPICHSTDIVPGPPDPAALN